MSDPSRALPERPSLEQLRKQAREHLATLRLTRPDARLADAQFQLARSYGFESWPRLVRHVHALDASVSAPRIVAPVSRWLGANDAATTVAFWRDVLGFDLVEPDDGGAAVLVSGEARIRVGAMDWAPDFSGTEQPPGSAMVFFETSDVEAMRTVIEARGGRPGPLTKVNGLKLHVFEVRDPDGHVLWFGQSYQQPSQPRPQPMVRRAIPELPLDDVPAGVRHYRDVLGFSVNYEQHDIGVLDRDDARVLLIARTPAHTGIGSAFFYVRDADALYAEHVERGADVQGEPVSRPWGIREYVVLDAEGNRLTFGQTFE